jgi:cobalt-zinc-cadmium efflux system outer membrane protein
MSMLIVLTLFLAPPQTLELPMVLDDVAAHAPQAQARAAEVEVARRRVGVAGAWEDPTVSIMGESIPLPGGEMGDPMMITYRFSQPLNLFGRRGAAKAVAAADVRLGAARLARTQWDARAQAVALFYELWMNAEMGRLIAGQIVLLERMREAGLSRVRAGMEMGHHDVLRAEAEIARMKAEAAALDDEHDAMVAMLNALRGRPQDEPIGELRLPPASALPSLASILGQRGASPELLGARAMRERALGERTVAKKMYLPMIMLEGEYEQKLDGMPDGLGVAVVLSVPLWWHDRQDRELQMADAMVIAADRDVEAMQTMTEAELRMAWSKARAAERRLEALETSAIPALEETVKSAEASYQAGKGDFLGLLEATMALQDLRMERLGAVAQAGVARFELARISGSAVPGVTP